MSFKVGQKIVCVENFIGLGPNGMMTLSAILSRIKFPIKWHHYTIESFDDGYLILKELISYKMNGERHAFNPAKFRPLDEVLSEISIEELTNIPQEA